MKLVPLTSETFAAAPLYSTIIGQKGISVIGAEREIDVLSCMKNSDTAIRVMRCLLNPQAFEVSDVLYSNTTLSAFFSTYGGGFIVQE